MNSEEYLNQLLDELDCEADLIAFKHFSKFGDEEMAMTLEDEKKQSAIAKEPVSEKTLANTRCFETPSNRTNSTADSKMMIVTPKCDVSKPFTLLREPAKGEQVISINGSPLMVSRYMDETGPNLCLPLQDGRVYSLRAVGDFRTSMMPAIDEHTRRDLEKLKKNIDEMLAVKK